jgi:hypothetical protein
VEFSTTRMAAATSSGFTVSLLTITPHYVFHKIIATG